MNQLNHEIIVPEDMKSTMHLLDKSIISQFDSISQYTHFMEQKQQAEDEKYQKLNESNKREKEQFSASDGFEKREAH